MLVGIITDSPFTGGTFLSWSLHYLAGDTELFHHASDAWVTLTSNPLTNINAHSCLINHPQCLNQFTACINKLTTMPPKSLHSLYMHQLDDFYMENNCREYSIHKDSATLLAIEKMQQISKLIVVELLPIQRLYLSKFESRSLTRKSSDMTQVSFASFEEQHDDIIDTFFHHDKLKWDSLTNRWEYREFLSLNVRPFNVPSIISGVDLTKEHFRFNCFDLFNNLDKSVNDLFSFLELSIAPDRKNQWLEIYNHWRKQHYDRILFSMYFDQIINSIINNHYMNLTRFNLDIVREATIQHVLIYKHGLTLKSWGLEKFPNNTQDLYALLEPNIYHQVEDIYNVLK